MEHPYSNLLYWAHQKLQSDIAYRGTPRTAQSISVSTGHVMDGQNLRGQLVGSVMLQM